jgi:hypothetical protein
VTDLAGHLFRFNATTGVSTFGNILDNPVGVAFDATGDLFVAQRISDNVLEFPAGGGAALIVIPNGAFAGSPADLAIGPNGLLYVATDSAIYRFDVSGGNGVPVDSFGTGGRYVAFTPAVPEPGTWVLVGAGIILILLLRPNRGLKPHGHG